MGSIGQKSTFFQNSINTNQQRHLYRDKRGSRIFLSGGGGGGPGSSTYFTVYIQRGVQWYFLHIFQGGSNFFQGGGGQMLISIETHITTTCDFPGEPLSPPLDPHIGNVEFRHESVRPPFKLRNSKC